MQNNSFKTTSQTFSKNWSSQASKARKWSLCVVRHSNLQSFLSSGHG